LDATVNPDFSQVESDAFPVDVNQRFPVFYSEKRPFFMDGAAIFALAGSGSGDNSMQCAVHTRRIIDPVAAATCTGRTCRLASAPPSATTTTREPCRRADRLNTTAGPSRWTPRS